jgi:hypothetical protein
MSLPQKVVKFMSYRNNGNVAGTTGRRCDCECVFECLLKLLEEALGENNNHCCHRNNNVAGTGGNRNRNCECVFECLVELLEDALKEDNY